MRIINAPTSTLDHVIGRLTEAHTAALFVDEIAPALWTAAELYGVNPVGVVAQSFKETGGGTFGGQVKPRFYNPCGLKIRHQDLFPGVTDLDRPLAHAMFSNWQVGATAHVQHPVAYTGTPLDRCLLIVDPRFSLVGPPFVTDFEQLGGRWAPSPTYGTELVQIAERLRS